MSKVTKDDQWLLEKRGQDHARDQQRATARFHRLIVLCSAICFCVLVVAPAQCAVMRARLAHEAEVAALPLQHEAALDDTRRAAEVRIQSDAAFVQCLGRATFEVCHATFYPSREVPLIEAQKLARKKAETERELELLKLELEARVRSDASFLACLHEKADFELCHGAIYPGRPLPKTQAMALQQSKLETEKLEGRRKLADTWFRLCLMEEDPRKCPEIVQHALKGL